MRIENQHSYTYANQVRASFSLSTPDFTHHTYSPTRTGTVYETMKEAKKQDYWGYL